MNAIAQTTITASTGHSEFRTPNSALETVCAWCQQEAAVRSQPHQSHGICRRHKQMMELKIQQLKEAMPAPRDNFERS